MNYETTSTSYSIASAFNELFFQISDELLVSNILFPILWALEKVLLFSLVISPILYKANWVSTEDVISYMSIARNYDKLYKLKIVLYTLFGIIFITVTCTLWRLIVIYCNHKKSSNELKIRWVSQILHIVALCCSKLFLLLIGEIVGCLINITIKGNDFNEYTHIDIEEPNNKAELYVALVLSVVCLVEIAIISIVYSLFIQRRSICNASIWTNNNWYADIYMIIMQLYTSLSFPIGFMVIYVIIIRTQQRVALSCLHYGQYC